VADKEGGHTEHEPRVCTLSLLCCLEMVGQAAVEIPAPLEHCSRVAQDLGQQLRVPDLLGEPERLFGIRYRFDQLPVRS
jgi:hypothetical protein